MAKFIKVLKIVLITLIVATLGGFVILYCVNKELGKQILDSTIEFVNKPLPIVGVSFLVFGLLVWKIFSSTIYGKKALAQMKAQYDEQVALIKAEYEVKKTEYATILSSYEHEIDVMYDSLIEVCDSIPNKKVKEVSNKLNNEIAKVKTDLRKDFDEIVNSDVETLLKSKEEIIDTIVEIVKKEMEEKYGKESQEAINSIAETKKI